MYNADVVKDGRLAVYEPNCPVANCQFNDGELIFDSHHFSHNNIFNNPNISSYILVINLHERHNRGWGDQLMLTGWKYQLVHTCDSDDKRCIHGVIEIMTLGALYVNGF